MARTFMPTVEQRRVETAKAIAVVFWVFTIAYAALSVTVVVAIGPAGLIFTAALASLWFFMVLRDALPHLRLLRKARKARREQELPAGG